MALVVRELAPVPGLGLVPGLEPGLVRVPVPVWHKLPQAMPAVLESNPKLLAYASFAPPEKYFSLPEFVDYFSHFPLLTQFLDSKSLRTFKSYWNFSFVSWVRFL